MDQCVIPIHRPNFKEKIFFLISGMIMSIPLTLFVESITGQLLASPAAKAYGLFLSVAVIAPLIEEFSKAFPLFYRHGETERSLITLGFYVGLGFGIMEFLAYVIFFNAPALVRIFAVAFHASNTSIVAYGIGRKNPWRFYLMAVMLHAANNFSALLGNVWFYVGIPAVALAIFTALGAYLKASDKKFILNSWPFPGKS